ncbi:flippase [Methanobrevibacter curvatus]|uniref:Colanic acid exporter n=1 Tax=Methanobrevibacter curvatus TaxID=49547 RepID=A0A166CBI4_9EURY|nr:flippase [Methanobrevibacter curvatus]KZX14336.1 colanic acid exporter [Methanobrevibacter curvatus]
MSSVQKIFKNISWLAISQVIANIFGFFWTILIANYLEVGDFGIINAAISCLTIASIFMDLGMSTYITRDVSRNNELVSKYLGNMVPLKLIFSFLVLIIVLAVLTLINYPILNLEVFFIFGLQFALSSMSVFFYGIFQANEKMKYQGISTILNSSMILIFTALLIYFKIGLLGVPITYMLAALISLIYLIITIRNIIKINIEFDAKFCFNAIKKSLPFGLTNFFTTIYFLMDTVMLVVISGDFATGIYSSAYKVIFVFTALYSTYTIVIFPLFSKFYRDSSDFLKFTYEKSMKYLLMVSLPICVLISFYAGDVISLIYKSEYILSAEVIKILIWCLPFLFINGLYTQLLNSSFHEKTVTKINIIACVFNVIVNYILIIHFSFIGASIAVVLINMLIFILFNYIVSKEIFKLDSLILKSIGKILISSIILGIILYALNVSLWIGILISIFVYSFSLILLKTLDSGDFYILKQIFRK